VDYVPLPAYVVTREWDVRSTNAHLLTLIGATRAQVDAIPPEQRNILHLAFDPGLPLYERLSGTREAWERTARCSIYGFKLDNVLCQHDEWYRHRVQHLMGLPRFAEYWQQIQIDSEARGGGRGPASVRRDRIGITHPTGTVVRVRPLLMLLGAIDYPRVVAFLPADRASRRAFGTLHLPTPDNGWGSAA
jgi:MmyB-like transcription regulator ligand binding domain